ncbi:MAG: methylated-DNA--[protein]-cysteine S-methyltransferase [Planctomycetales bacterium]|nr:methylated-DNA--[protein]-cysteine S-methyltransferase [Planctomycetales bacterium]
MTTATINDQRIAVQFDTELGWMAIQWRGPRVDRLVFGCRSSDAARSRLQPAATYDDIPLNWVDIRSRSLDGTQHQVLDTLVRYAQGQCVDFDFVRIDDTEWTPFQARVLAACRQVGYGEQATYAELARRAGSPLAARAVGNIMARNRVPLIIPCHRIIPSSGSGLGGFSAPGGVATKRRLLQMESAGGQTI